MDLKMCRICGGIERLKHISDQDSEMINKLFICANINIHPGDVLPKLICAQCETNLDLSYRLRKQSEATQKRLRFEMQRKLRSTHSLPEENISCKDNMEHLSCGKIDLCQHSENSSENEKVGKICCKKPNDNEENNNLSYQEAETKNIKINQDNSKYAFQTLLPQLLVGKEKEKVNQNYAAEIIKPNIADHEEDNVISSNNCNNYFTNTSDDSSETTFKEITEVPIVSDYYSIDLLSSSGCSTIDCCDDFSNEQVKSRISDVNVYTCDTCNEVFTKKHDYRIHIKQHGVERYQCTQCCKFFPSRFRLKRHEEIHKEIASYQCTYCSRNYRALYNLKRHVRTAHLGQKGCECNVCNISFSRVDVLKRHLQLHSDEKKFPCSICSKSFKTKDYLRAHHKSHHIPESELPKANKRIKKDNSHKSQCAFCGRLFKSSFAYKNHLLIHTNEKPYKCDCCNKNFRTIAALTIHQRVHDDYRPYQCDLCLKSFRQTAHLKEHKLLHLDNVPNHVCSICQAPFAKKSNLKAHMRMHTKEKPFKCADCSAEFSYIHLLQRHASKVHYRSVHKIYTANDVDKTIGLDTAADGGSALEAETYLYIDTVVDDDDEFDNVTNCEDVTDNNQNIMNTSSPKPDAIANQNLFDEKTCTVPNSEPIIDFSEIQSQPFDENFVKEIIDDENEIREQKVDVLVAEETQFTSSLCNAYKRE